MEYLPLATTGRSTTRLGFGCSSLMGGSNRRESLFVLDAAWDAGIRHFDVAPLYGFGAAESCLGEFLRRHSGEATVTTKYGILPPPQRSWTGLARSLARPVLRVLPSMKQRLARAARSTIGSSRKAPITIEEARASLERSRAALRVDRIDLWLLHDVAADRLTDPALLDFMRESVASGAIAEFGVSHEPAAISALWEQKRDYCHVLQFEWSVRQPVPVFPGSFRIHHRALAHNLAGLRSRMEQRPELLRNWSRELDVDLAAAERLAALMLRAALLLNPGAIVLVSSRKPSHIAANARSAEDAGLDDAARRLYELVQQDVSAPAQDKATGAASTAL